MHIKGLISAVNKELKYIRRFLISLYKSPGFGFSAPAAAPLLFQSQLLLSSHQAFLFFSKSPTMLSYIPLPFPPTFPRIQPKIRLPFLTILQNNTQIFFFLKLQVTDHKFASRGGTVGAAQFQVTITIVHFLLSPSPHLKRRWVISVTLFS